MVSDNQLSIFKHMFYFNVYRLELLMLYVQANISSAYSATLQQTTIEKYNAAQINFILSCYLELN